MNFSSYNKLLHRTPQTVTIFAEQKYAPVCYAGELVVMFLNKNPLQLFPECTRQPNHPKTLRFYAYSAVSFVIRLLQN